MSLQKHQRERANIVHVEMDSSPIQIQPFVMCSSTVMTANMSKLSAQLDYISMNTVELVCGPIPPTEKDAT